MINDNMKEVFSILKTRYEYTMNSMLASEKIKMFDEWSKALARVEDAMFINSVKNYVAKAYNKNFPTVQELIKYYNDNKGNGYTKEFKEEYVSKLRSEQLAINKKRDWYKRVPRLAEIEQEKIKIFVDMVRNNLSDKPKIEINKEHYKTMTPSEFIETYYPTKKEKIDVLNHERDILIEQNFGGTYKELEPEYYQKTTVYAPA